MSPKQVSSKDGLEQLKRIENNTNNAPKSRNSFLSKLSSLRRRESQPNADAQIKSSGNEISNPEHKLPEESKIPKLKEYIRSMLSKNEDEREEIRHKISGWSGVLAPIVGFAAIFASISISPEFSWYKDALSNLVSSPKAAVIFEYGMSTSGLLMSTLAYGLYMNKEHTDTQKFSATLLGLSGISLVLTGLIRDNTNMVMHDIAAFGYFTMAPAALMVWGADMISKETKRLAGIATFISGFAASSSYLVTSVVVASSITGGTYISSNVPTVGLAFPEILESAIVGTWIFGAGLIMLNRGKAKRKEAQSPKET